MRLNNCTPFPAAAVPNAGDDDEMSVLFLCAVTYRIQHGTLRLSNAQAPLLLGNDLPYPNDRMFHKRGVSVCSRGHVYAPDGRATRATAALLIGTQSMAIKAFGARRWRESTAGDLIPTEPAPFDRVAMTWENAFGGMDLSPAAVVRVDGEDAFLPEHPSAYAANVFGSGYFTSARRAVDGALPQIEHPEQLVTRWDDRPEPVCFAPCPLWSGLRAGFVMSGGELDPSKKDLLASRAAPRTTFPLIEPGTLVGLTGMRPAGESLAFVVPPEPVTVDMDAGGRRQRLLPALDAIDIDAEGAVVRLLYRCTAVYPLIAHEARAATVETTEEVTKAILSWRE